ERIPSASLPRPCAAEGSGLCAGASTAAAAEALGDGDIALHLWLYVLGRVHLPIVLAGLLHHRAPELPDICLVRLRIDGQRTDRRREPQALERIRYLVRLERLGLLDRRHREHHAVVAEHRPL